jgi:transcriptional regulator with XRE-family HTH domain
MANTPKRKALGLALKAARESRSLTTRALGARIGRSNADISRWETGDRTPRPDQVARILTVLDVSGDEYDEIIALSFTPNEPTWVATTLPSQHQQLSAYVDMESQATAITEISPMLIPGLLQTDDYIRAIMAVGPVSDPATKVAVRIGRRTVLDRPALRGFTAVIGEAALYQRIGGVDVLREQLRHLLTMAAHPKIDLRIVTFQTGWHPMLEGEFIVLESSNASPVVHLQSRRSAILLHEAVDVLAYRQAAAAVLDVALGNEDSRRFLARLLDRMETTK